MYEGSVASVILNRMLARIDAKYDKREGSIIWDALAPAAIELQNFYVMLAAVLDEVFADTATRTYLIKRCAERGIKPKPSSYAIVQGEFTPSNVEIPIGERFSHEDYNYAVTEKISDGVYKLQCETLGTNPNGVTGQLIPIGYVSGLQTANITELLIPGEDEEDTESLRSRYITSLQSEAFGGNKLDYQNKVMSFSGVGGVKVYSGAEWNGGGTVKIVFVDSEHNPPTEELVEVVQNEIDPNCLERTKDGELMSYQRYVDLYGETEYETYLENTVSGLATEGGSVGNGSGEGIAPIGHFVTVVGAYETLVDVEMKLTYASNYSWDKVKTDVEAAIDDYLDTLNKNWSSYDMIRVRISQLESRILDVAGVVDIQRTKLGFHGKDLAEENLTVDRDSIVKRGNVYGN